MQEISIGYSEQLVELETCVYPDRYPTAIHIERETVLIVHILNTPARRIWEHHSWTAPRKEVNGRFLLPVLLICATYIWRLWHPRFLWSGKELWIERGTIYFHNRAVIILEISQKGELKQKGFD